MNIELNVTFFTFIYSPYRKWFRNVPRSLNQSKIHDLANSFSLHAPLSVCKFSVRRTLVLLTLNANFSKVRSISGCLFTHSNTTISTWCAVHSIHSIQDFDNKDHSKLLSSLQVQATALSLIWSVLPHWYEGNPENHWNKAFWFSNWVIKKQLSSATQVLIWVSYWVGSNINLVSPPRLVYEDDFHRNEFWISKN